VPENDQVPAVIEHAADTLPALLESVIETARRFAVATVLLASLPWLSRLNTTVPLPEGQIKPILRNVRRTQPLRFALGIHWLLEWGRF
jgi:hypothetical protein